MRSQMQSTLAVVFVFAGTATAQPANPPVRLVGPFINCGGDAFAPPGDTCPIDLSEFQTHVRAILNMDVDMSCGDPDTPAFVYEGVDSYLAGGNSLAVTGGGSTGTGDVGFHLNRVTGSAIVNYPTLRGPQTGLPITIEVSSTTEAMVENIAGFCGGNPVPRFFDGSTTTNAKIEIVQPVRLISRGGNKDLFTQFSPGDIIPPGTYTASTSAGSFSGSGGEAFALNATEIGLLELFMPDADGNGVSDLSERVLNLTQETAHPTLGDAVANANPRDELFLRAGTFNEFGTFIDFPITLIGDTAGPVVIDPQQIDRALFFGSGARDVGVANITFRNGRPFIPGEGGGNIILADNTDVSFVNCVFENGDSTTNAGGAVFIFGNTTEAEFIDCTFRQNTGGFAGGAIAAFDNSEIIIKGSRFEGNTADFGAAIDLFGTASATVEDTIFDGNFGLAGAGLTLRQNSSVKASRCIFQNQSITGGGAAFLTFDDTRLEADNCIVTNNTAGGGTAFEILGNSTAIATNFTISQNTSANNVTVTDDATLVLTNSIIWANNSSFNGPDGPNSGARGDVTALNNIMPEIVPGNFPVDPLFIDPANRNYAVSPGSPAIDAASNPFLSSTAAFDALGQLRFQNDSNTLDTGTPFATGAPATFPIADIGAIEFVDADPCDGCNTDFNSDNTVDFFDVLDFIEAVENGCP